MSSQTATAFRSATPGPASAAHLSRNAVALQDNRAHAGVFQRQAAEEETGKAEVHEPVVQRMPVIQFGKGELGNRRKSKKPTIDKLIRKPKIKDRKPATVKLKDYNPNGIYENIVNGIRVRAASAGLLFSEIKKQLEDDDDINWLEEQELKLAHYVTSASDLLKQIKRTPVTGRTRSKSVKRDELAGDLRDIVTDSNALMAMVKKAFPLNAGGFGAKGRAHKLTTHINPSMDIDGVEEDDTFVKDIEIDGTALDHKVYKENKRVTSEKSGPMVIMGYSHTTYDSKNRGATLTQVDNALSAIRNPQPKDFTGTPAGKDRGEGQYKNMNNTNAAGYAWLLGSQVQNASSQRWEWLHVRGAGLGGDTDSTNLVTGVRDANTHMIPFESNIRHLGTAVKNSNGKYSKLEVIWSVAKKITKHAYRQISIVWKLFNKSNKVVTHGKATFNPLQTSSNISKQEVDALEKALSEARENVK